MHVGARGDSMQDVRGWRWACRVAHVCCLKQLLHGVHFGACDPGLALGLQELAVVCDVLLQMLVLVEVMVDDVALVALTHHARIRRSNAASSDNAHRLVLCTSAAASLEGFQQKRLTAVQHATQLPNLGILLTAWHGMITHLLDLLHYNMA